MAAVILAAVDVFCPSRVYLKMSFLITVISFMSVVVYAVFA